MTRLASLQKEIANTAELLHSFDAALVDDPAIIEFSQYDIRSLNKLQRKLSSEFSAASSAVWRDECRYRLFKDSGNPPLLPVASILGEFQHLVTLVFHSLDRGSPLTRASITAEALDKTAFGIGYCFEGSVGFVLTLPNERLLGDLESTIDSAILAVFGLARLADVDDIRGVANKLGRPIVRAVYRWADFHVKNGIGSDVQWRRKDEVRGSLFVQHQEFRHLQQLIDKTGEETTNEFKVEGILTAANVTAKTFQFSVEGAEEIRGTFEDAIDSNHVVQVPSRYTAILRRTSTINFSTDEEKHKFELVRLE